MAVDLKALLEATQLLHPNEVEDKTCPVCLEDYLQGPSRELPRKLPCGHLLGTECLSVWASSQTRVTSTKCPWCRQRIINPVQLKRAARADDRELVERYSCWLGLVSFAALRIVYFGNWLAWLPLGFLYVYTSIAIKRRLTARPRLGMMLLVLGFCVGTFFNEDLGYVLMKYGKAPFEPAILRAYKDHTWTVLGLSLAAILLQIFLGEQTGLKHGYSLSLRALLRMCVFSCLESEIHVGR